VNRLTNVDGQAHTWDNNSNPSASSGQALLNDGEKTYTYDQVNRLIRVTTPDMTWSAT
jgi:YD repeat-containing protein